MSAQHTPGLRKPHITETAEYWFCRARYERAAAKEDAGRRFGTVDSMRIHERQAAEYQLRGEAIAKATGSAA